MKRISTYFLALAVVVAFSSPSLAYPRAVEKFRDGAKDVITSPIVLKDNVMTETKDVKAHVYPLALTGGLVKGAFYMGKHVVDGAIAMATSPLEIAK